MTRAEPRGSNAHDNRQPRLREREMAKTQAGSKMLEDLEERILEQARPYLRQLVEEATKHEGIRIEVRPDVATGNILGFFQLE